MERLSRLKRSREWSTGLLLAGPLIVLALVVHFFGGEVLQRILTVLFINVIMVLGLQIFMGNSGVVSFAQIGFMGIGAYASALFSMSPQAKAMALRNLYSWLVPVQMPFVLAVIIGGLMAALVAALVGYPLMRLSGAAAVIATFALLIIVHTVLINWSEVTNGPRTLFGLEAHTTLWVSVTAGILFLMLALWFKETPLGLQLRASREDEAAAASIGINIVWVRWVAFVLAAFVTGVAGALWAHFITSFSPLAFYLPQTFLIISMAIIGGSASVSGAVVGAVAVTAIFEGIRGIENVINISAIFPFTVSGLTEVCLSIAMILILILRPSGILGSRELHV
ncbi:MAG: branched-chain amino acid ABC transporter permease [Anaerolineae bacterium]